MTFLRVIIISLFFARIVKFYNIPTFSSGNREQNNCRLKYITYLIEYYIIQAYLFAIGTHLKGSVRNNRRE